MPTPNPNIQETGALTHSELQDLNQFFIDKGLPVPSAPIKTDKSNPYINAEKDIYSPLYNGEGDYWGRSRFDRRNPVVNDDQFENLSDMRANEQSIASKLLNGTIKMVSTAGTTFLDNTIGFVWGLGQGFANLADGDDDTNFWRGLWDNDFNKAMMAAQDAMEKIAPNYYTQKELNRPWYQNIWTANFWGDKFLKNMGFTMGSVASMAVGLGDIGAIAGEGASLLTKSIAMSKLLKNSKNGIRAANALVRGAERAGQITQKLVNTAISAHGEAAIEAINAVKGNEEIFLRNLENWKQQRVLEAQEWYLNNNDVPGAYEEYLNKLKDIDASVAQAKKEDDKTQRTLGNSVYGMNMALLGITNNLEFGKYIKGGFNQNKSILGGVKFTVDGVEESNLRNIGKALAAGKKAHAGVDETLKKVTGDKVASVIGGTLARNFEEGFEEGAQRLISDSGQMQAQAKVNTAMREWNKKNDNSLYAHSINPDVTDELVSRTKAFVTAWNESFGNGFESPGWEEVFLGALTGGIGTLGFKVDNKTGKVKPAWQGGFWDEITKFREEAGKQEAIAEKLNKAFDNPDSRKRIIHTIASLSLAEGMEADLLNNDILKYKNKELIMAATEAFHARDNGALEMFRGFYEGLAQGISDEDINDVKAAFRDSETGKSYFDGLSNDEIRKRMRDKAESTLKKIDTVIESYDFHLRNFGDKLRTIVPNEEVVDTAIQELSVNDSLRKDLERRKKELEAKQVEGEDNAVSIEAIDREIKSLKEQYDKYTKNPQSLFDFIREGQEEGLKYALFKDANAAKIALGNAESIQDIADIYYHIAPEKRQGVLDAVYEDASPELRKTLDSFRDYVATTQALPAVLNTIMDDYRASVPSDKLAEHQRRLERILDEAVNKIASNKDTSYDDPRGIVVRALKDEANALRQGTGKYIRTDTNSGYLDLLAEDVDDVANLLNDYKIVYHTAQSAKETSQAETPPSASTPQKQDENKVKTSFTSPSGTELTGEYTRTEEKDGMQRIKYEGNLNAKRTVSKDDLDKIGVSLDEFLGGKDSWGDPDAYEEFKKDMSEGKKPKKLRVTAAYVRPDGKIFIEFEDGYALDPDNISPEVIRKVYEHTFPEFAKFLKAASKAETPITEDEGPKPLTVSPQEDEKKAEESQLGKTEDLPEGEAEVSMRANSFLQYNVDGHTASPRRDAVNQWFNAMWADLNMGYTIADIQNNYIWKMLDLDVFKDKDEKGRIPVRYVKFNNHLTKSNGEDAGLNRFVFLATEYTDAVKSVFPEEERAKFRTLEKDGKQYLVIGSLGVYSPEHTDGEELTPLEKMWDAINKEATALVEENPDVAYQIVEAGENGENTNYIYAVNNGEVITKFAGQDSAPRQIRELLASKETNPRNLGIGDLMFAIVMGDEESGQLYTKYIGKDSESGNLRPFSPKRAGQVYVYLPDSQGKWIPWGVDPVAFTEIMGLEDDNPIKKDIQSIIHSLAEALVGSDYSEEKMKERRMILGQLKESLLFGSPDVQGTNLIYKEPKEEETDDYTWTTGNTLDAIVAGVSLYGENEEDKFHLADKTPDQIEQELYRLLRELNPQFNIKSTVLQNTPDYYIENGVMATTAKVLGVVNARAFAYPIKADMTPDIDFKVTRENPEYAPAVSGKRVWLNGQKYTKTEKGFVDENDVLVTDAQTTQMLTDVLGLEPDSATFKYNRAPYWIIGDNAYTMKKDGNFVSIEKKVAEGFYEKAKKREADKKRKEEQQKAVKSETQTPTASSTEQGKQEQKPVEKKKVKPQKSTKENVIFVDRFKTYSSKFVSGEQAGYITSLPNASDYFDTLGKDTVDATVFDALAIMVGQKLGIDPTELTLDKIMDVVWNSKYQDRLENAIAISDQNSANQAIDDIIDNIIKCGL